MIIGLDLDGTLYAHPQFFAAFIRAMHAAGHEFYCTSAHSRSNWDVAGYLGQAPDRERLLSLGVPADIIRPDLLHHDPHGDLAIKGRAAINATLFLTTIPICSGTHLLWSCAPCGDSDERSNTSPAHRHL